MNAAARKNMAYCNLQYIEYSNQVIHGLLPPGNTWNSADSQYVEYCNQAVHGILAP